MREREFDPPQPFPPARRGDDPPQPDQPLTPAAVVPASERGVVWVPDAYGRGMVPIARDLAPSLPERTPPRDLSPRPLIDPRAQLVAAGGVCAAGVGWGAGQLLNALAGVGTGALLALALLVIALRMPKRPGRGGGDTYHITHHNKWFGKSTTNL
ncbi:hypothetical protein [Streptomyces sp. B6B3]|uniref:hypothetical protein n=1 Tax=Streptomyces sp. B6B3 TaxID=3153570 RepID=UPI00325D8CDE